MNKEEIIIGFKNQNGFRITPDSDITTGKVIVNGIEITSVEDWEKVTKSLIELQQENEKLNHYKLLYQKVKERNMEAIEWVIDLTHDPNNWFETDAKPSELLEILKGKNEVSNAKLSRCCRDDLIYLGYGKNTLFSFALGNLYHYCCSRCGIIEWSTVKEKCKYKWYKYDTAKLRNLLGIKDKDEVSNEDNRMVE